MTSNGHHFNYFAEKQLIKLTYLVQFKRELMSCLRNLERGWSP